jgi:RsiW-degrading membrane proteinase PrsW (M82 family)
MEIISALATAVAPGMAISLYIYWADKFEPEPRHLLLKSFFLGALATAPALLLENWLIDGNQTLEALPLAVKAFLFIALVEEACKFAATYFFAYKHPEFNEPFDGITYAVMVAMGFATAENIIYVFNHGLGVGFLRMFTAVPAHAFFGIIQGYFMGMAKFRHTGGWLLWTGLLLSILLHGVYDFSLLKSDEPILIFGAIASLALGYRFAQQAIVLHQHISPFKDDPNKPIEEEELPPF